VSLATTHDLFTRRLGTLWRDTGLHVLALPEGDGNDVVVLGGGSAVLWRLLESPVSLGDLLSHLDAEDPSGPSRREVTQCLEELVDRGLVERLAREPLA
jgi:hypothetical protein